MTRKDRIRDILSRADRPLSTNEIADELGVDWHTANDDLHTLAENGTVRKTKWHDRMTTWETQ